MRRLRRRAALSPALRRADGFAIGSRLPSRDGCQGAVAEWLRRGLQILVHRFDSGPRLQTSLSLNHTITTEWTLLCDPPVDLQHLRFAVENEETLVRIFYEMSAQFERFCIRPVIQLLRPWAIPAPAAAIPSAPNPLCANSACEGDPKNDIPIKKIVKAPKNNPKPTTTFLPKRNRSFRSSLSAFSRAI